MGKIKVRFSSEAMRMVTVHGRSGGPAVAYVKGALAVVAESCDRQFTAGGVEPMTAEGRQKVTADNRELAGRALRVLTLATKDLPEGYGDLAGGMVFFGLVGMIDPLQEEGKAAVGKCRQAGIRVVMITGDQVATATEIGRHLGLDREAQGRPQRTAHGRELAGLDAAGSKAAAGGVGVFARLSPEQKLRIVDALQAGGEVVAMTGDIVRAVEQGRVVYANILRFVHYLFSCNLAEILVGFVALMVGWPLLWGALEIHWLNMVTDVFPAMALALEPSDPDAMGRPPRDPRVALVTPQFLGQIARHGVLLSAATLLAFFVGMRWYGAEGEGLRRAGTVAFMTLALAQLFHAFSTRSRRDSAITARLFTNGWLWAATAACVSLRVAAVSVPYLRDVLRTVPLAASDCGVVLACSLAPAAVVELVKLARRAAGGVTQ